MFCPILFCTWYVLLSILPKVGTPTLWTSLIYLRITSFTPTKLISCFLQNRKWCADFMLTRTTGRTFFSHPKLCVSSFSLPIAVSISCFAALLNIVFSPVRFPSFFSLDRKVVFFYRFTVLLLPIELNRFGSVTSTKPSSYMFVIPS